MKYPGIILSAFCLTFAACGRKMPEKPSIECIPAKVSVGEKYIETVVQWNTRTGEARLLNAASMSVQSAGNQGSLIGWVPVVDLQQALRNLPASVNPEAATKSPKRTSPTPHPQDQRIPAAKQKRKVPSH